MQLRKLSVIMLALLLAAMAMVPMVNAANADKSINNENNQSSTSSEINSNLQISANLTSKDAVLRYSIVVTSSTDTLSVTLTPRIWRHGSGSDALVYTGNPTACTDTKECKVEGTFIPLWNVKNVTASYFANATVVNSLQSENYSAKTATGQIALGSQPSNNIVPVKEVMITNSLNLVHQSATNAVAGTDSSIPWGGKVEQDMNGDIPVTVVYGADGQPRYWADDQKAANLPVPAGGFVPATQIINVPSNTYVIDGENNITTYQNNQKILTVQSNSQTYSNPANANSLGINAKFTPAGDLPGEFNGWVEDAKKEDYNTQLDSFTAYWKVPAGPTTKGTSTKPRTQFLFNAFQGQRKNANYMSILQPVLEWSQVLNTWTIASWAGPYYISSDGKTRLYLTGGRSVVQEGDVITGSISWDSASSSWTIITSDSTHVTSSSLSTDIVPKNSGLSVYGGVYEAYNISSKDTMIHNSEFYGMNYKLNGNPASINLQKWIASGLPAAISSHVNVVIVTNPSDVQLITQN
jgi:hypothetical protein